MQISEALKQARQQLAASDSARLDAELLLCHSLDCKRSRLYAHPEAELAVPARQTFFELVTERAKGRPVAHLIQEKEFWSLRLQVTRDTLIPRPETEILVEAALPLIPLNQPCSILDLGTGSGAIALALASERPLARVTATDCNNTALKVARHNAEELGIGNVSFIEADWFNFEHSTLFDLIVSNPPYIDADDPHLQCGDVQFESRQALVASNEGLGDIDHIVSRAQAYLHAGSWLLLEHGYQQGEATRQLFRNNSFTDIRTDNDYAGLERITLGMKPL